MTTPQSPQPIPPRAPYPPGQPHAGFPPAYGYPLYPPAYYAVPPPPPAIGSEPPRVGRWFVPIFGVLLILVTVGALALAAYAPSSVTPLRPPSGWSQVYQGSLSQAKGEWDVTTGCTLDANGLYADEGNLCGFLPSKAHDLTSQGFYFSVVTAPAGDLAGEQQSVLAIGADIQVVVDQMGTYTLYYRSCDATPAPSDFNGLTRLAGEVPSLHVNPLVSNTLSVLFDSSSDTYTFAANGQPFLHQQVCLTSSYNEIAVGAAQAGQARFTAATFYSASGGH